MKDYFRKKAHTDQYIITFDDLLILPGYTRFNPNEVELSTNLGKKYHFNLPFISSAMDTVTESEMAIKMALFGGLGVIHRNCSYQKQLQMVHNVKRARSFVISDVATINQDATIDKAKFMMEKGNISGLMVVDEENKVSGIITKRDIPYSEEDLSMGKVKDFMTKDVISITSSASREESLKVLYENRIEKLPIIEDGYLKGLITIKDLKPEFPLASIDKEGRLLCALAMSPKFPKPLEAMNALKEIQKYVDVFFIDVADFHKKEDIEGAKKLMEEINSDFVFGNIGTFEAAEDIITKGDYDEDKFIGLKVGMGSGSICTTSIQTGVGAPTLFATAEVADAIATYNPKIGLIADGGFKNPGEVSKAIAVGADMIMSGHFFAGCTESPGYVDTIQGRKVKVYRGMGSKEARASGYISDRYSETSKLLPEGITAFVPYLGDLSGVIATLREGLASGMIYVGAKNIEEMKKARIGLVTNSGQNEQKPHDLL